MADETLTRAQDVVTDQSIELLIRETPDIVERLNIEQLVADADPAQLAHEFKLNQLTPVGPALKLAGKFLWQKLTGGVETTRREAVATE